MLFLFYGRLTRKDDLVFVTKIGERCKGGGGVCSLGFTGITKIEEFLVKVKGSPKGGKKEIKDGLKDPLKSV